MKIRLINANALKEKIEQSDGEGTIARYCKRVLTECLDNDAPTIDAIPVEWLNKMKRLAADYGDDECVCVIEYLFDRWQEEQEAR